MRVTSDNLILALILSLAVAAAAMVTLDQFADRERQSVGDRFQAVVGGLGMGPHAELTRCSWQFDPRLAGDDDAALDALPGSHDNNPWHAAALFPYDPTTSNGLD